MPEIGIVCSAWYAKELIEIPELEWGKIFSDHFDAVSHDATV